MPLSYRCHIPKRSIETFNRNSINWYAPGALQRPDFMWLSNVAIKVGEEMHIKRPDDTWTICKRTKKGETACGELSNYYLGQHPSVAPAAPGQVVINTSVINEYLERPLRVDTTMCAPFANEIFIYRKKVCLNNWIDTRFTDFGKVDDALPLLEVIYSSLCGLPKANLSTMLAALDKRTGPEAAFSWSLQWFANAYQCPGRSVQTSLWWIGPYGTGKNTMFNTMAYLIGPQYCTQLKEDEIDRGWTGNLEGKILIFADEFEADSKKKSYKFVKEHSSEREYDTMVRNKGQKPVLAYGSWNFASNDSEAPITVKIGDRRNTFFLSKTFETPAETEEFQKWVRERSLAVHEESHPTYNAKIIAGFAKLMSDLVIDFDFINKPLHTELKTHIINTSKTAFVKFVEDLDEFGNANPAANVIDWWFHTQGPYKSDDHVLRIGEFLSVAMREAGMLNRPRFKEFMKKAGYDLNDVFPRKRPPGKNAAGAYKGAIPHLLITARKQN